MKRTAKDLTREAYDRHRAGEPALWLTTRAVYATHREDGQGRWKAFWLTMREKVWTW